MDIEENTGTDETVVDDAGQLDESGNDDSALGEQDATQDAAGQDDKSVEGLKAAAVAERNKRQVAEAKAQTLQEQMAVVLANRQEPQPKGKAADIFSQMGIQVEDDDDYLTAGQVKTVLNGLVNEVRGALTTRDQRANYPDYEQVVGKQVGNTFQYAPPLKKALENNPALISALQNSPNAAMLAYEIAKNDPDYKAVKKQSGKTATQIAAENAESKINAANKKLSVSAARGGGTLDSAAAVAAMTDVEFSAYNQKIMDKAL